MTTKNGKTAIANIETVNETVTAIAKITNYTIIDDINDFIVVIDNKNNDIESVNESIMIDGKNYNLQYKYITGDVFIASKKSKNFALLGHLEKDSFIFKDNLLSMFINDHVILKTIVERKYCQKMVRKIATDRLINKLEKLELLSTQRENAVIALIKNNG